VSEEANYMGNGQKGNPYSNMYNHAWAQHPNLKYSNNNTLKPLLPYPQSQKPRKPSALEEALIGFSKVTQKLSRNQKAV
jgi:hypothetical protein